MKARISHLAIFAVSALTFSPLALRAQDDQAPPPPMDGGAPPPPDQGAPPPDQGGGGDDNASFQNFYDNLSSQGQWVQTPDYGYAFQPAVSDPNWAPYTDGHWVYTAYGWTWASDEPWGWATYHYGRWVNIVGTGWVWVPGYQWAPAWVSWRYGGGYCGWAPLPPSTFVGVEVGGGGINLGFDFQFGSECDTEFGIGPGCYNFIPIGYIGERRYHGYYMDRSRNFTIINNTRNVTNIYITRNSGNAFSAVRVGGPSLADINAHSRTPVQQVRLAAAGQAGISSVDGGTMNIFRPRINPATLHQARPQTVARTLSSVEVNRGTSVTQPLQVNSRYKPAAPSASAIAAARAAQAHAPQYVATSTRIAPTVSASTLQRQQTQYVQKAQANVLAKQHTQNGSTPYHPAGEVAPASHPYGATTGQPNAQIDRYSQTQNGQQHSPSPSTQYHPSNVTPVQPSTQVNHYSPAESNQAQHVQQYQEQQQQQAANLQQQREAQAAAQQRVQQPDRTPTQTYVPQQQEHIPSSTPYVPQQHYTPQPQTQQHYSPQPQAQQHYSQQQPQPQQHSSGSSQSSGGQNKNNNGQNQGH
jgi:hypothetical protein